MIKVPQILFPFFRTFAPIMTAEQLEAMRDRLHVLGGFL
ncbi:hypothetical protein C7475_103332 [Chitinophaga sp. S165]|jgi:hypothetical protein|nr:hypothetical protein C7475_103332 [Chitinophaga sp. S165]